MLRRSFIASQIVFALLTGGCRSIPDKSDASTRPTAATLTFDHGGVVRGDTSKKRLSLVFTGGDFADGVPTILRVCRERHVPAAFFVTGDFLRKNPDAAKAIVTAGFPLGPHSDKHLLYCDWDDRMKNLVTEDAFKTDLKKNLSDLQSLGSSPHFFLPPFEWFNQDQVVWANALGLTLINFSPGSGSNRDYIPESDPKFSTSTKIASDILAYEQKDPHGLNGFILLLHAGSMRADKMTDQLDGLVDQIQRRGYVFVPLDALLGTTPDSPK